MRKLSKRCWSTLPGLYDHTPTSPLAKALLGALMRVMPLTSTLRLDPLARRVSVTHWLGG